MVGCWGRGDGVVWLRWLLVDGVVRLVTGVVLMEGIVRFGGSLCVGTSYNEMKIL